MAPHDLISFEQECEALWKAGKVKVPLHLSGGNEDFLINLYRDIKDYDWVISTHRNHYHYILHNGDKDGLLKEITGDASGICRGNSGSMHTTDMGRRFVSSCLVGCGCPIAIGIASAIKLRRGQERVWCFVGDGAVDEGMFFESVHLSEGRDLPVVFVVEDNDRSVATNVDTRGMYSYSRHYVLNTSRKVIYHKFKPTYQHVGNGEFISF